MSEVTARIIDGRAYAADVWLLQNTVTATKIAAGVAAAQHSLDGLSIRARDHLAAVMAG